MDKIEIAQGKTGSERLDREITDMRERERDYIERQRK